MRVAFTKRLCELAIDNKDIIILTNDAPTPAFLEFKKNAPLRFINAGIAEANMTGMAAGLALSGKISVTYSIVPFVLMRCYEQVRDDICFQNANVKIVGIGGGVVYSTLGGTHLALEDVSMMRALPNMAVVCPADPIEAEKAADAVIEYPGPVYVRLGRTGEANLYRKDYSFNIGKAVRMRRGKDLTIIGYGPILEKVLQAAEKLEQEGISTEVINMHTVKPLDDRAIVRSVKKTASLMTVEEHSVIGGLASAVSEVLSKNRISIPVEFIALKDQFLTNYGPQTEILDNLGFSPKNLMKNARKLIEQKEL